MKRRKRKCVDGFAEYYKKYGRIGKEVSGKVEKGYNLNLPFAVFLFAINISFLPTSYNNFFTMFFRLVPFK